MFYQIRWFDGFGGKPDYSKTVYNTPKKATEAAEAAIERCGGDDVAFDVVTAGTHRKVKYAAVHDRGVIDHIDLGEMYSGVE